MNGMGVYMGEGKSEKCPNDGAAKSGCGKNHKIRNSVETPGLTVTKAYIFSLK